MNLFNRILIILVILAVMVVVPFALIFPEQAHRALEYMAGVVLANLDWLYNLTPGAQLGVRIGLAAVGMLVFCIGLLFLVLEVIRIRRSTVKLKDGSGELLMNGVAGHLAYHIDLLPEVLRVRPNVKSAGKSVRASLYVETAPGISVIEKSGEIRQTARQVLEEQLGLQVKGDIKVVIKPVPYPRTRPGRRPAPAAAAAAAPKPVVAAAPAPEPVSAQPEAPEPSSMPPWEDVTPEPVEKAPLDLPEEGVEDVLGNSEFIDVKAPPPQEDE
jgi:hypothetical protein